MASEAAEQAWLDKFGHVSSIRERTKFISGFEAGDAHARAEIQKPMECGHPTLFLAKRAPYCRFCAELAYALESKGTVEAITQKQSAPLQVASDCGASTETSDKLREYREALTAEAALLEKWAKESREGGWSTHQVDPMKRRASEIRTLLAGKRCPGCNEPIGTEERCTHCDARA